MDNNQVMLKALVSAKTMHQEPVTTHIGDSLTTADAVNNQDD